MQLAGRPVCHAQAGFPAAGMAWRDARISELPDHLGPFRYFGALWTLNGNKGFQPVSTGPS